MKIILSVLLFAAIPIAAYSQKGTVTGKVQSNDGGNVTNAKIYAIGQRDTIQTDMDGNYKLQLPAGSYRIAVESQRFQDNSDSVTVKEGEETFLNIVLNRIQQIGTIGITVDRKAKDNSVAGAIQAKQISTQMVEAISAEDFKKTTIRTTGDAIKRIPGATIMDGKFANIRGMFDRYNAGYLNGAPLPSTESDRKAFSFDIIPASLLDNIVVIKSGTPDLIGDFGGGIIRINTKNIPNKLTQSFSFGMQYNSITNFREIQAFPSTTGDYFGISGKSRQIPALSASLNQSNAEQNVTETKKFNNDWTLRTINPMPAPRFNYSIGVPFKLGKQRELGLLASVNYSLTQKYSDGLIRNQDNSDNHLRTEFNDKLYSYNVQNGGILNLSYKLNNQNRIDFKNLYTLNYDVNSTLRSGMADYDNNIRSEGFSNQVNSNRLFSTQMNGTHILGENQTTITWLVNYGNTKRSIPDFRIGQYAIVETGERFLVLNDFFNAGSGRFFSDLAENTLSIAADAKHSFKTGKMQNNIKYGLFIQNRKRTFSSREFVYGPVGKTILSSNNPQQDLAADKISTSGLYLIEKTSNDVDTYDGDSKLNSAFVMLENHYPLFVRKNKPYNLKLIYGVRFEQFNQVLSNEYFKKIGQELSKTGVTNDFLPSINIIAPLTTKTNLRAAMYKTVNRPEMRELAPFSFYNFNLNSEVVGNRNLKRAILQNYDIRYEIFPGKEDMFSVGLFLKNIINPIEFSLDPTQSQIRTFTYNNEKSAQIKGLELEVRKNLGFLNRSNKNSVFKYFSLYGNLAIMNSKVQFKDKNTGIENRSLQGQSPYVVNTSLFYENPKSGWQCNVNFNKIGTRIAYIGVPKNVQPFGSDIYEFGRTLVDMQVGKTFKKSMNLKLTVGDILAQNTLYYQDLNNNNKYDVKTDNKLFSFTNGRTITISYGYTF